MISNSKNWWKQLSLMLPRIKYQQSRFSSPTMLFIHCHNDYNAVQRAISNISYLVGWAHSYEFFFSKVGIEWYSSLLWHSSCGFAYKKILFLIVNSSLDAHTYTKRSEFLSAWESWGFFVFFFSLFSFVIETDAMKQKLSCWIIITSEAIVIPLWTWVVSFIETKYSNQRLQCDWCYSRVMDTVSLG